MNVNVNSRFSQVPQVNNVRSRFEIPHSVKTSFNVGQLIPFYYEEVLPGDTFTVETNLIARMQPLVAPIMDDIYLDMYYFFVPNRLVWKHWKEFMGENTESAWYPTTEYNVPHVMFTAYPDAYEDATVEGCPHGSLADYFGYPVGSEVTYSASQLPFRAYGLIWNEFFRDENLQDPVLVDLGDSDVYFDNQTTYGGDLLLANKYHDYFTSGLPDAQKGPDVYLPLNDFAPVVPMQQRYSVEDFPTPYHLTGMESFGAESTFPYISETGLFKAATAAIWPYENNYGYVAFDNMYADLSQASATTINALRMALATQSFYEKNARAGTRYRELVKSHFGVISPDSRQQVPELLNYNRVDININQVVQQSQSTSDSPLGKQAAYALSADSDNSFMKSFTEHGMVIGLCCARYKHSYQQGLNRRFSRRTMFDYYFPVFANLGEQPVLNKEIFVSPTRQLGGINDEVFGYQEAFAEYRYHPDIVTGEMRSGHSNTLDVWHLADWYEELPRLSPDWIAEDKSNVDRVLSVTSEVSNQLFCDFYIKNDAVRVMPMFSIPGLPRTL